MRMVIVKVGDLNHLPIDFGHRFELVEDTLSLTIRLWLGRSLR